MNRIRSGWDTVSPRDGPTPAGIPSSPPDSASTVILQGQWLSLKEKYWQAVQSSMSGADLQFDCHHYLILWTQDGGGGGPSLFSARTEAGPDCSHIMWTEPPSVVHQDREAEKRPCWVFFLSQYKTKKYNRIRQERRQCKLIYNSIRKKLAMQQ